MKNISTRIILISSLVFSVLISSIVFYSFINTRSTELNNFVSVGIINYDRYNAKIAHDIMMAKEAKMIANEKISKDISDRIKSEQLKSKIVLYIIKVNSKIDKKVAYELANAIVTESRRQDIPANLLVAIVKVESHFDKTATGSAGEVSYFQVMPRLHLDKVAKLKENNVIASTNLHNVNTNTAVGATILKNCFDRYKKLDMKLACYNGSQHDTNKTYAKKVLKSLPLNI